MNNVLPFQTMLSQEPLQVTRIRDCINPGSFVPHRHRFSMLLWITEGFGKHSVDFETIELRPNRIFPMTEGQVHQMILPATDGSILIFKSDIFHALSQGPGGIDTESIFDATYIDLNELEADNFSCLWNLLFRTSQQNAADPMLINQLRVLLGCLDQCADHHNHRKKHPIHHPVLQQLKRLINDNFNEQPDASWYAESLNTPLWKLNAWCREVLGENVHCLINERMTFEAKSLLATTHQTVKEITFNLGREDPSNFAKTFKRLTGMTPREYRCALIQK